MIEIQSVNVNKWNLVLGFGLQYYLKFRDP